MDKDAARARFIELELALLKQTIDPLAAFKELNQLHKEHGISAGEYMK